MALKFGQILLGATFGYYLAKRNTTRTEGQVCFIPTSREQLASGSGAGSIPETFLNYSEDVVQAGGQMLLRRVGDVAQIALQDADGEILRYLNVDDYFEDPGTIDEGVVIDVEGA